MNALDKATVEAIVEWLKRYAEEHNNPQALWFAAAIEDEFGGEHDGVS